MLVVVPIGHEVDLRRFPKATVGLIIFLIIIFIPTYMVMHKQTKRLKQLNEELLDLGMSICARVDTTEGEPTGAFFTAAELYRKTPEQSMQYFQKRAEEDPDNFKEWHDLKDEYDRLLSNSFIAHWGFVPEKFPSIGIITAIFLHGGILHLVFNLWFLYLAGTVLEDVWGRFGLLAFFLLFGIAANFMHLLMYHDSAIPCVGASGAIAGLMGAFAVRCGGEKVNMFYALVLFIRPIAGTFSASAWVMVLLWFIVQLFWGLMTYQLKLSVGVAYWAHIGGAIFGALLALIMRFWVSVEADQY